MRKIIAFTSVCLFSLLLKNENGNCKSACDISKSIKVTSPGVTEPDLNADINIEPVNNGLKPYDGFFRKL